LVQNLPGSNLHPPGTQNPKSLGLHEEPGKAAWIETKQTLKIEAGG